MDAVIIDQGHALSVRFTDEKDIVRTYIKMQVSFLVKGLQDFKSTPHYTDNAQKAVRIPCICDVFRRVQ